MDRRKKYDETREVVRISLHKERDADLLKFLEKQKPFSTYIKKLIEKEMRK